MSQLMQDVRRDLEYRSEWMGEEVWKQLTVHWNSSKFKKVSATNKRNRCSMDGASLHTGGSIPHRLHWKRMKTEKGTDPLLIEFYFRTHRKKDQSWMGVDAESAYDEFERKNLEISSQNSTVSGEDEADCQPKVFSFLTLATSMLSHFLCLPVYLAAPLLEMSYCTTLYACSSL